MPELPEIEHLRQTLEPLLCGARILSVRLMRPDVVRRSGRGAAADLLLHATIAGLRRHGKQLAIHSEDGRALCVHLGMSGQLYLLPDTVSPARLDHVHCIWCMESPAAGRARLCFRDPRRFGGLWPFSTMTELQIERWSRLGPDALSITGLQLSRRLGGCRRAIKAVLMDQQVMAGIGNIYADESLFAAGIHPLSQAGLLPREALRRLAIAIRRTLQRAVAAGGSTLRDYVDGTGACGRFTLEHCVYGRAGQPCARCRRALRSRRIAQRSSVFCPSCQHRFSAPRRRRSSRAAAGAGQARTEQPAAALR